MKRWLLAILATPTLIFAQASPGNPMYDEAVNAFKKEDYTTARMLFEAITAQNPRDQTAQNYLRMIAVKEKGGGAAGLEASLKQIIIPKVDLRETTAREAVTFVAQRVRELSNGKQALNVVWMVPGEISTRVTLSLQNVPASEVLKYIADSAGLQLAYDSYAVKIKPATP